MKRTILFCVCVCACGVQQSATSKPDVSAASNAEDPAPEIRVLSPEWAEMVAEDPHWPENLMLLQLNLAQLGYFERPFVQVINERMIAGLRRYKRDAGLPAGTSVIDRPLMKRMREDIDALVMPAGLGSSSFSDFGDLILIEGTWRGAGQNIAYPEQRSEIECDQRLGVCFEAIAMIGREHVLLSVLLVRLRVEEWTGQEVVAVDRQPKCAKIVTRINRVTQRVSRTRTTTSTTGTCEAMPAEDFHLDLVDGGEVWDGLWEEFEERRRRVLGLPSTE